MLNEIAALEDLVPGTDIDTQPSFLFGQSNAAWTQDSVLMAERLGETTLRLSWVEGLTPETIDLTSVIDPENPPDPDAIDMGAIIAGLATDAMDVSFSSMPFARYDLETPPEITRAEEVVWFSYAPGTWCVGVLVDQSLEIPEGYPDFDTGPVTIPGAWLRPYFFTTTLESAEAHANLIADVGLRHLVCDRLLLGSVFTEGGVDVPVALSASFSTNDGADWFVATLGLTGEQTIEVFASDGALTAPGAETAASNLADPGLAVGVGDLSTIAPETIDPAVEECLRRKITGFYYLEPPIAASSEQSSAQLSQQLPVQKPSRVAQPANDRTVAVTAGAGASTNVCAGPLLLQLGANDLNYDGDIAGCKQSLASIAITNVGTAAISCCVGASIPCALGGAGLAALCCIVAGGLCALEAEKNLYSAFAACKRKAAARRRAANLDDFADYLVLQRRLVIPMALRCG